MNKIISLNIAILTVSDTRNKNTDKSGKVIQNRITPSPHKVFEKKICKDNKKDIEKIIKSWLKEKRLHVIIATGGTGLTKRDITRDILKTLFEKALFKSIKEFSFSNVIFFSISSII